MQTEPRDKSSSFADETFRKTFRVFLHRSKSVDPLFGTLQNRTKTAHHNYLICTKQVLFHAFKHFLRIPDIFKILLIFRAFQTNLIIKH